MIQKIKLLAFMPATHKKELKEEKELTADVSLSSIKTRYLSEYIGKNIEYIVFLWNCDYSTKYTHIEINNKIYKIDSLAPCKNPQKIKLLCLGE